MKRIIAVLLTTSFCLSASVFHPTKTEKAGSLGLAVGIAFRKPILKAGKFLGKAGWTGLKAAAKVVK